MRPLVYYCRWHHAKLQLQGRDGTWVWGFLVYDSDNGQRSEPFRFDSQTQRLFLGEEQPPFQLDEMGVVVSVDTN